MRRTKPAPENPDRTTVDPDTSTQEQPQVGADAPNRRPARLPHERDESAIGTGNRMNEPAPPSKRLIKDAEKNVDEGQLDTERRGVPNDVPGNEG